LVEAEVPQPKDEWVLDKVHVSTLCTEYGN
jgi:hypothetical protein